MNKTLKFLLFFSIFFYQNVSAQIALPVASNINKSYIKKQRDPNGAPGKNYWQNRSDYYIKVNFDPSTAKLKGVITIEYVNNSPDTLSKVVFKLYPNIYQKESIRAVPVQAQDLTDGVAIEKFSLNGQELDTKQYSIRGTNMTVRSSKILPKQKVQFDIAYSYDLNRGSFIRGGQIDSGAFFIAYFFPRIAVYDDIDGWNEYPYTGQYEFYNDFGQFKTEITVPGDYQVWATGELKNATQVLKPKYVSLIDQANKSDEVVDIISEADLKTGSLSDNKPVKTWEFQADNVTDFAFGISNHYVWKASSLIVDPVTGRRTRVDAVFNPDHKEYLPVIKYGCKTVDLISNRFPAVPFPFSHETIFDGPTEMEYPMMVVNSPLEKPQEAIELTAHEIFHSIFPFYVGINETKYSFMDEGFATLSEFLLHPLIDSTVKLNYDVTDANAVVGSEQELPIMTLTPQLAGRARYVAKNLKPALGYFYVKEMLGDALFNKAMHYYIEQWKGKHPTPHDFFNCINTGSGVNLNWFWKSWFFDKGVPDLAISKVNSTPKKHEIRISNLGNLAVPVHLTVYFKDGTQKTVDSSIVCWSKGNKTMTVSVVSTKRLEKIILGTAFDLDVQPENNIWVSPK
ncbi:M1 family metallopeptidase [Dyadobacter frigoris]|uniref:M1 family metallopeptidase n=1 Tax=Dyadobacter frigoris TaxID=2576211 RepID=A0A4U6D087_9BACT|nr:M1 family metallopeptidase [Dyadobacter frigoris]TKT90590.1 M1 family metallopeptidase [Dyadobacter frigoris]GLU51264.1 peptidase M1 [Dyadobacter frigoris]